ncbi:MAG: hypothetical protein WA618_11350 [Terriglobales bacterium]
MNEQKVTGVEYPTITLGGVKYLLRFTRGALLFRLSEMGVRLADRTDPIKSVATITKILSACLEPRFAGTFEELTELLLEEGKMREAGVVINDALGKVFPPTQVPAAAGAEAKPAVQ